MSERNVARDVSNELLLWGAGTAIDNYFKTKKLNNYKDWQYRKAKELDRKLTEEQKQRVLEFMNSEEDVEFVYRAKTADEFAIRYKEATGREMSDDGLIPTDLFYDAKLEKTGTPTKNQSSDFNMVIFVVWLIVFFPVAIWYYIKHH